MDRGGDDQRTGAAGGGEPRAPRCALEWRWRSASPGKGSSGGEGYEIEAQGAAITKQMHAAPRTSMGGA